MIGSDDTDRIFSDLKTAIEDMPSPAICSVLSIWRCRCSEIKNQLLFVGKSISDGTCPAAREYMVLMLAIAQIEAACHVDKGNGLKAFQTILNATK